MNAITQVPKPINAPVLEYAVGSPERSHIKKVLAARKGQSKTIPMFIGDQEINKGKEITIHPPHEHNHVLGTFREGERDDILKAITIASQVKQQWQSMSWEARASIFLKAADLLSGPYRQEINAATMLCQSKNIYQSEVDAACELIDFFRFNVFYMRSIYEEQPFSSSGSGIWNRLEYRPLEGFIFAISPFNFTSIAANLPCAPALMGNTVVWKPSYPQVYSAEVVMRVLIEAGLPPGVINLVYVDGPVCGDVIFNHTDFAGLHFTGSTEVFRSLWSTIGSNLHKYRSYPRIVGETGGKDFIMAHRSADVKALGTAIVRGGFEYQGQKCSAVSRVYAPACIWEELKHTLLADLKRIKIGSVEDFSNFMNAVITKASYDKITQYIDNAKKDASVEVIGGEYDDSKGYFISPTLLVTKDPNYVTMREEIFGPVVTLYIYPTDAYESTLGLLDRTSPYGLTGGIFSQDRQAIEIAMKRLMYSAGNLYINDKPTGAVVGQQPFGGGRLSGTNDKAGASFNLHRWVSPRTIKETFVPATDFTYPFMQEK